MLKGCQLNFDDALAATNSVFLERLERYNEAIHATQGEWQKVQLFHGTVPYVSGGQNYLFVYEDSNGFQIRRCQLMFQSIRY